jgi:hypothetical protein
MKGRTLDRSLVVAGFGLIAGLLPVETRGEVCSNQLDIDACKALCGAAEGTCGALCGAAVDTCEGICDATQATCSAGCGVCSDLCGPARDICLAGCDIVCLCPGGRAQIA